MALWTPANYGAAVKHWYDAADAATITESGGTVTGWNDKSGNGYHLAQATTAKQGTLTAANANFNSKPTIAFPSAGGMTSATKAALGDLAWLMDSGKHNFNGVYIAQALPANVVVAIRVPSTGITISTALYRVNGSEVASTADDAFADPTIAFTIIFAGRIKGNGQGTVVGRFYDAGGTFTLNNRASDWARTGSVDYGEFLLVAGALSDADVAYFEGYLAWRWGLEGSLPAGHTYKSAAPTAGTLYTQGLQATTSPAAQILRQVVRLAQATTNPIAAATRQTAKPTRGSTTPAASIAAARTRIASVMASASASANLVRSIVARLTQSTTPARRLVLQTGKAVASTSSPVATLARTQSRLVSVLTAAATAAALVRSASSRQLATTGPLARMLRTMSLRQLATTSPAARLIRATFARVQAAAAAIATAIGRQAINAAVMAATSPAAALGRSRSVLVGVLAASPLAARLVRATSSRQLAATSPASSATRSTTSRILAVADAAATAQRQARRALQIATTPAASLQRAVGRILIATSSASAGLARRISTTISASAAASAAVASRRAFSVSLQAIAGGLAAIVVDLLRVGAGLVRRIRGRASGVVIKGRRSDGRINGKP